MSVKFTVEVPPVEIKLIDCPCLPPVEADAYNSRYDFCAPKPQRKMPALECETIYVSGDDW